MPGRRLLSPPEKKKTRSIAFPRPEPMKPAHILSSSIVACLLATASRAAVIPYAEYHLGEAGSLGASNKPQHATGNSRNFSE